MSDYIKRDDAIAVINNYIGDDSPYAQWLVRKIEQIDAAPRWIPCEERLPESTQEVLVTGINGCVYTSRIVHGEFEYGGNVIAWMPLPGPYEGEVEK